MGYLLSRLDNLPSDSTVSYYLFLLRDSFDTPIVETIDRNFKAIATAVGDHGVYAVGAKPEPWLQEVAATYLGPRWNNYVTLLPAFLLTDTHPEELNADSLRLFLPIRDVDKRFGSLENFLREITEFIRGSNDKFMERIRDEDEFFGTVKAATKFELSAAGFKIDVGKLVGLLKGEGQSSKTPYAQ